MITLITGGAGKLGIQIVRILVSNGNPVRVFDLPSVSWKIMENFDNVEIFRGDITNIRDVRKAIEGVDVVLHLAALLPPKSEPYPELTMNVNVEGTRNLVDVIKYNKIPIVFSSSISTYGITAAEEPSLDEHHPQQTHNVYSNSKILAEKIVKASGVPFVILRIAPLGVAELIELSDIIPYRADQRVEFVYVADAARALLFAAQTPEAFGRVFNIAGGVSWQMTGAEYIRSFYDALGIEVDPIFSDEHTAIDWYDTSRSRFLGYQRTTFNMFLDMLRVLGEELGLR